MMARDETKGCGIQRDVSISRESLALDREKKRDTVNGERTSRGIARSAIRQGYLPPWANALPPLRVPMIYRPSFSRAAKGRLQNESWPFRGIRARD